MLHFKYHVSVTELLSCFDKGPFVSVNSSGVLTEVHFFFVFCAQWYGMVRVDFMTLINLVTGRGLGLRVHILGSIYKAYSN